MNKKNILLLCFSLCASTLCRAGEKVTLVVETPGSQYGYSQTLTLNQGESAELVTSTGYVLRVLANIQGKDFDLSPTNGITSARLVIAGPAVIKLRISDPVVPEAFSGFATFDVHRVGTASAPVPIPQEAGTTWQVILEASSDLVNWTAVNPGDFPSSTPQRYFRTRLVRR